MARKRKVKRLRQSYLAERGELTLGACVPCCGAVTLPLFAVLTGIGIAGGEDWPLCAVGGVLAALSVLMLMTLNWKITFDSNGFTHRSLLRKTRRYTWSDVTKIKQHRTPDGYDTVICCGKRRILVDAWALNRQPFLRLLRLRCRGKFLN